jgi:hypothetical protein
MVMPKEDYIFFGDAALRAHHDEFNQTFPDGAYIIPSPHLKLYTRSIFDSMRRVAV